jgi:hypothetical protein
MDEGMFKRGGRPARTMATELRARLVNAPAGYRT